MSVNSILQVFASGIEKKNEIVKCVRWYKHCYPTQPMSQC